MRLQKMSTRQIVTITCLFIFSLSTGIDLPDTFGGRVLSASAPLYAGNILYNGDFEEVEKYENLWDGVGVDGNLKVFNAYSIMEDPMTSCGCFECIAAIVPEVNGIMIVDRDFAGMTPVGMTFSTLAGQIGGGSRPLASPA